MVIARGYTPGPSGPETIHKEFRCLVVTGPTLTWGSWWLGSQQLVNRVSVKLGGGLIYRKTTAGKLFMLKLVSSAQKTKGQVFPVLLGQKRMTIDNGQSERNREALFPSYLMKTPILGEIEQGARLGLSLSLKLQKATIHTTT